MLLLATESLPNPTANSGFEKLRQRRATVAQLRVRLRTVSHHDQLLCQRFDIVVVNTYAVREERTSIEYAVLF